MRIAFTKMQGAGNDYIYIDATRFPVADPKSLAQRLSNRHFSVGADGLVLILPSDKADIRMRMFNADGSEAQMCGNAARCVARYAADHHLVHSDDFSLETLAGIKPLHIERRNGTIVAVRVDMGEPVISSIDTDHQQVLAQSNGQVITAQDLTIVNMGNPHAVCFVEDINTFPVSQLGPVIEHHPLFPHRTNVEFVQVIDASHLLMRVWERGTGETMACGTGACAAAVAAVLKGKTSPSVFIQVLGGELLVCWDRPANHIFLQGPAEYSFEGTIQL